MMHMHPYNNLNLFNPFEGESSFQVFQQQKNRNLYNQLATDPFIFKNNNAVNFLAPTDQNFSQRNFQQSLKNTTKKKMSNNVYSKFTIPSITSIISQPVIANNANVPSSLSTLNNICPIAPSSKIPSISSRSNSPIEIMEIDFNYNDNIDLLIRSQVQNAEQSSDALSYFATPDKDTTISLQNIIDGMKVMQEISRELTTYHLDRNLLQGVMNDLLTDLNENPIEWLVQENWKEMSSRINVYEFKETLTEKKFNEKFRQDIDDLIEEHMKEIKKFAHNEILCQEIVTELSNLERQFKNKTIQTEDDTFSSMIQTTTYHQGISQEVTSSSLNDIFIPRENNFSYDKLTIGEISTKSGATSVQTTFKCNEVRCSKEYNCYAKLKSHKVTHTNDKPFTCNVPGCNKKFKRSGELIKHQLDHLN